MLDASRDQAVTVKIVQLLRPDDADVSCNAHNDNVSNEQLLEWNCCEEQTEDSGVGFRSKLFESVYLGETFCCYAMVTNGTDESITELSLSVDLQTNQRRCKVPLSPQEPVQILPAGASIRALFTHEVTEIGQHLLICTLAYNKASGGKLTCRKLYKFTVLKPLDVHTKFYDATDELFLEAQVKNTTDDDLIMEHIALEPAQGYRLMKLMTNPTDIGANVALTSAERLIRPGCVRQFLYGLEFTSDGSTGKMNHGLTVVGKLSMVWHTTRGRRGRLQTFPLERMIAGCGDLKMKVVQAPNAVKIQRPFRIICRITNCCDRLLEPKLTLEEQLQSGLVWNSKSNQQFGPLQPSASIDITLVLIPVTAGLKYVSGMQFQDVLTKRTYEPDDIAQVFVYT